MSTSGAETGPEATHVGVGVSTAEDAEQAVADAVRSARVLCADPALALLFATFDYSPQVLARSLASALPGVATAGCTTPGVLAHGRVLPRGIAVALFGGKSVRVGIGVGGGLPDEAREAGRRAVADALAPLGAPDVPRARAVLLFADVLSGGLADVLRGAVESAGTGVVWGGGGIGDPLSGRPAAQLANGAAYADRVLAVALDCGARIGSGIAHGWLPLGPPALVTRSSGARVTELEYEPAFELFRRSDLEAVESLSPDTFPAFAVNHPLGIPQANGEYLIRDPVSADRDGSVRCLGDVPEGALVRVMQGTPDELVHTAADAAGRAVRDARGPLSGALVFDCVSRSLLLGSRVKAELSLTADALGWNVPLVGCLTFGEVGAFGAQVPQFHNKTVVVLGVPR